MTNVLSANVPHYIVLAAALAGLFVASYIRSKKADTKPFVCPLGSDCAAVIHSPYSTFLGIPVEMLGIVYYALVVIMHLALLASGGGRPETLVFFSILASAAAFLFSGYLTFIQAVSLKQWCTWCLTSAALCVVIFLETVMTSEFSFLTLLTSHRSLLLGTHLLGVVLGLGGATYTDIFFFRFLRDLRISAREAEVLGTISQVVWLAIGILFLTGLFLYLPDMDALNHSPKFLMKMVVTAVLTVNGALLHFFVTPYLLQISFGDAAPRTASSPGMAPKLPRPANNLHGTRRLAYALGAVSITSWYLAFFLGLLPREAPLFFLPLFIGYTGMLLCAIGISQIVEQTIARKPALYD